MRTLSTSRRPSSLSSPAVSPSNLKGMCNQTSKTSLKSETNRFNHTTKEPFTCCAVPMGVTTQETHTQNLSCLSKSLSCHRSSPPSLKDFGTITYGVQSSPNPSSRVLPSPAPTRSSKRPKTASLQSRKLRNAWQRGESSSS